jgi:hypothetical protein
MKNTLDNFIKSNMITQNFYKNLGMNNALNQMLESHTLLNNNLGISFSQELMKGVNNFSNNFVGFESLSRTLEMQTNLFQVPHSSLEALTEIIHVQKVFFDDLKGLSKVIIESQMPFLNQVNNLQFAMTGISEQILKIATYHSNWQLINDFEEINEQAFNFTDNLNSDSVFSEEESIKFQNLIDAVFDFIQKYKHIGRKAYNFLELIVLLYSVYQMYESFQTKAETITKEDISKSEKRMLQAIELRLKDHKEYRVTNCISKVMFKPRAKTMVVTSLPKGYVVVVLEINHKWAFVSYRNPKDDLMETGWVMKKYLNKNK